MLELCYELRLPFVNWISVNQVHFCYVYRSSVSCMLNRKVLIYLFLYKIISKSDVKFNQIGPRTVL